MDPTHKTLQSFYNSDYLSDIKIIHESLKKELNLHKIILASKSNYFYEQFAKNSQIQEQKLPNFVKSTFQKNFIYPEMLESILKNCYNGFSTPLEGLVKGGLDKNNCLVFYFVASGLQMKELMGVLENFIIENLGKEEKLAQGLLRDAIKGENQELQEVALNLISQNFQKLTQDKKSLEQLLEIPYDQFVKLIGNNKLNTQSESQVLKIVQSYIEHKEQLPEKPENIEKQEQTENDENKTGNGVQQDQKEETEKQNQEDQNKNAENSENNEKNEENKDKKNEQQEKKDQNQNQNIEEKQDDQKNEQQQQVDDNLDLNVQADKRIQLFKLSEQEKEFLVSKVKLNFVENEDLLMASQAQVFQSFKDVLFKAVSQKLAQLENPTLQFPVSPRQSYKERVIQNQSMFMKSWKTIQLNDQKKQGSQKQKQEYDEENQEFEEDVEYDSDENEQQQQFQKEQQQQKQKKQSLKSNTSIQNKKSPKSGQNINSNLNFPDQYGNNKQEQTSRHNIMQSRHNSEQLTVGDNSYLIQDRKRNSYLNPGSKISGKNLVFSYTKDQDTNGVLYYLGTYGLQKQYENPHSTGQCKVFCSSLRTGRLEDFVSREVTNLSTNNEKNSFLGVDLGKDRFLFPTCYTVRNRNASTHVCLNWCLEGSVNGKDWYVLDKRINFSETNQRFNAMMENERQMLMQRGASTTWGVDTTALRKFFQKNYKESKGFRMFKITQLFENSHGSDNLCLSGLELYGEAYGNRWENFD